MANHKATKKDTRQANKRRERNRYHGKTTRNAMRDLMAITDEKAAAEKLPTIESMLDKLAKRNIIHKKDNTFVHLSPDVPYCEFLRKTVYSEALKIGLKVHKKGTVAVIQGPRFNTMAESKWFINQG